MTDCRSWGAEEFEKGLVVEKKRNVFEILFKDSIEYFRIENARMLAHDGSFVRFMIFDGDTIKEEVFYPLVNVYRIKKKVN